MIRGGAALLRSTPSRPWYGWDGEWRRSLLAGMRDWPQLDVSTVLAPSWVAFWMTLEAPARAEPFEAVAIFEPSGTRETYGLPAMDSPRVFGGLPARTPRLLPRHMHLAMSEVVPNHRNPDGSMCLWYPRDVPERRWTHDKGLISLAHIITNQVVAEDMVRAGHEWPLDEEGHGFPQDRLRAAREQARGRQR